MPWTCPECRRSFGRTNQSHGCAPSTTVDGYFDGRPPVQRAIFDRIAKHIATLEDAHIDPVFDDPRIAKTLALSAPRRVALRGVARLSRRPGFSRDPSRTTRSAYHQGVGARPSHSHM